MSAAAPRPNVAQRAWAAIDERFQLSNLVAFLSHKEVPVGAHSIVWYYLGGLSLFLFVVQIGTGILLLMNYQVGENTSYESMKNLVGRVPFGWLIRSIHCWSAHLMTLSVIAHLFSVLFVKAYRKPRELTWYSGFAMLGLVLGFGFSGYLLPWNELSYFATAVGTDSVKAVPVVGPWLLRVLRGGEEVSVHTLYRFFALHVCILPLAIAGLIGAHLLFIQRQGMAEPLGEHGPEAKKGMPFFPNFALRDLLLWVVVLNVLALLAVVLPFGPGIPGAEWELGEKANPLKPAYPGIKPEWYFLWVYQMLKEFPAHFLGMEGPQACLLLTTALMGVAFFVPLLDRNAAKGKPSPLFTDLGVAGLLFLGFLTLKAWDVGVSVPKGKDPAADPAMAATIARTAAIAILVAGLAVSAVRKLKWKDSAFDFTIAVLLQALLHGFFHVSWLAAGGVAAVALIGLTILRRVRGGGAAAAAAVLLAASLLLAPSARGDEKGPATPAAATASAPAPAGHVSEASWPADFRKMFDAAEKGAPVLDEKAKARFRALPTHAQELFFAAAKSGMLSGGAHLATLLSLDIDDRKVELVLSDNCFLCHTNPDLPDEILFRKREKGDPLARLEIREVVADVHVRGGLMCAGCHGGKPTDLEMSADIGKRWPASEVRHKDRSWIPEFCARCHSSSEFMRAYNPSLPVDQLLKYRTSKHGQLLLEKKDSKAAQCVSCHGVHGIRPPDSTTSLVYRENIPSTCGKCHADAAYMKGYVMDDGRTPLPTDQLEKYKKSVHGIALLTKHDAGAPACNSCHGNHAALPPQVQFVSQVCRNCHAANGNLFDGSPHKKAFMQHAWPECETCHGKHDIQRPTDAMLGDDPNGLCHACHAKYGQPKCDETARYFHQTITALASSHVTLNHDIDRLAERGFDVDELKFQSSAVSDALRKTRLGIHTFDRSDFARNADATSTALDALKQGAAGVWKEYRFRRNGLLLATVLISVFAVLLYLKIREVDRR